MKIIVTKWKPKEDTEYAADGLIRVNTVKTEYGSLMLTAHEIVISGGFMNSKKKIAFVAGKVKDLVDMIAKYNLVEGADFSLNVAPHRIVVLEKIESDLNGEFGYSEKVNPSTGAIMTKDGESIYRKTEVVQEGSDIKDVLVTHDKDKEAHDDAITEFEKAGEVIAEL